MNANQKILNYELVRPLGEGGMGEVWLARHALLGRQVAIKSLHKQLINKDTVRQRFKLEAATLAKLQHPNIVILHDYVEDEQGAYLILEYVEGRDLSDYITDIMGPIPEPQLTALFSQILDGFGYAHAQNIVHRDIKPSNFIITADNTIKVLDFGIAKVLDSTDQALTKTGSRMGTVLYMSPEQVKGGDVDVRSDVYSLGVTLFQMATGQCPYNSDTTEFHIYNQIVNEDLPRATSYYPGVSVHIEAIIRKATEKDPANRFQNCAEFLAALQNPNFSLPDRPKPDLGKTTTAEPDLHKTTIAEPVTTINRPGGEAISTPPPAQPPASRPPSGAEETRKRKKVPALLWIILAVLAGGAGLAFVLTRNGADPARDKLYVIASALLMRSQPDLDSDDIERLPYGQAIEVAQEVNNEWITAEYNGRTGYLKRSYLSNYDEFQQLDHLASSIDAKELIEGSYHKLGLLDFFKEARYRVDLPEDMYEEVYGESKRDSEVWLVNTPSNGTEFTAGIPAIMLEWGKRPKDQYQNSVVILENKANPDRRRLVAFRHLKSGISLDIGSISLDDYPGYYIKKVELNDLNGYSAANRQEARVINSNLSRGKEGILMHSENEYSTHYLISWDEQLVLHELTRY